MHMSDIKMEAQTGLTSNEMADALANEARQPAACDAMVSVGNTAFQDVFWPCARATATEPKRTMSNLCDAVKQQVRHLSRGSTIWYDSAWRCLPLRWSLLLQTAPAHPGQASWWSL